MVTIKVLVSLLVLCLFVSVSSSEDLQVGTSINGQLAYARTVKMSSIPFKTRTKSVFYNGNDTRVIRGISAIDHDRSKAKATITSGGVGFTFANIRLKSERGEGLHYQVQIFV